MKEGKLWVWHMVFGLVIFVFLGLHMTIMHLDEILGLFNPHGGEAISWENVLARSKSLFFAISYVVLLGTALFHGLYGLRNILFELNPSRWLKQGIQVVLILVGITLFIVGTYAAIAAHKIGV